MKKIIFFFTFFIPVLSYSQISFEKAYFIDNSDNKTECLIKNIDWRNNPISFNYKIDETSEIKTGTIKDIKSFQIYNHAKYVRATLKIDRSSSDLNKLSDTRTPEFVEETLFLQQLVDGDANLYKYINGNLFRYFFKVGSREIEQLIYKPYAAEATTMAYNEEYKQQLTIALNCSNISSGKIIATAYKEKDLTDLFLKYNKCINPDYAFTSKKNKGSLNLSIRPRVNYSSLDLSNSNSKLSYEMENKIGFGFGLEAEYIFPFNKNKWSIIVEPTYLGYKSEIRTEADNISGGTIVTNVDYKDIELPIGIRHHMYINNKSNIFLNAQYVLTMNMKSSVEFKRDDNSGLNTLDLSSRPNLAFGCGYNYNNKYGVEIRYFTKRDITGNYLYWLSKYQNISLIFSYNLF